MSTVTISTKYQVVIPLEVRKSFQINPGEKLQVIPYDNRIELIPVRRLKKMRGFLTGMKTAIPREEDRI